ncbi:hypothetical protein Tco_0609227 [Tanacetum coccineum]
MIKYVAIMDVYFGTMSGSKAPTILEKHSIIYAVVEEEFICLRCLIPPPSFSIEVRNRMQHFGKLNEDGLNPEIVEGLIHVLDEHNGLVRLFRTAQDRYNAGERPGFKIRLCSMGGVRGYELPKSDIIGGIVFEDRPRIQTDFDVIIEFRGEPPQRIDKLHQSYMSLQFLLLFAFGEP